MKGSSINVLITGAGGSGIGNQILKALKISSLHTVITGTDTTLISTARQEVDHFSLLPAAKDPSYIDNILKLCRERNIHIIFPGSEPELVVLSKHRKLLVDAGVILPVNSEKVIETCFDKFKTNAFLSANGFEQIKTYRISDIADIDSVDYFPVVIKPNSGSSGSSGVMIAQNKDELHSFVSFLLNLSPDLVAQEYLGDEKSEFTAGVLSSMEGEIINSIAVHRIIDSGLGNKIKVLNKSGNNKLGKYLVISSGISQGRIGKYPEVTKVCEAIAAKIESKGPLNIQCRLVEGKLYVFEINPRYSGTTPLRALAGFNEPEIMIRKYVLNEHIEKNFPFQEKIILRTLKEVVVDET